jgi:hypothetical protein
VDLQTQRANTRNRYPKRASRFDLLIDKDEDTSTLVLTTAIRPEVTAKRYSRGTRGSSKIALEQCNSPNRWELVKRKKYANWRSRRKVDANKSKSWFLMYWLIFHYIALHPIFISWSTET